MSIGCKLTFDDVVLYVLIITWYVTGLPRYTCLYRLRSLGPETICLFSKTTLPSGEYNTARLWMFSCKSFVIFEAYFVIFEIQ